MWQGSFGWPVTPCQLQVSGFADVVGGIGGVASVAGASARAIRSEHCGGMFTDAKYLPAKVMSFEKSFECPTQPTCPARGRTPPALACLQLGRPSGSPLLVARQTSCGKHNCSNVARILKHVRSRTGSVCPPSRDGK